MKNERNKREIIELEEEDLPKEIDETRRFMDFIQSTGRETEIEKHKRKRSCIHVLRDFAATATYNHKRKEEHLRALDKYYKPFRAHALNCERCRSSLEAIFSFEGHENIDLFPEQSSPATAALLDLEWERRPDVGLYFCKMLKGFRGDEITYISPLPLDRALKTLKETKTDPLKIRFKETHVRKKTTYGGDGIPYFQLYLYTKTREEIEKLKVEDKRYTKVCIRSRTEN